MSAQRRSLHGDRIDEVADGAKAGSPADGGGVRAPADQRPTADLPVLGQPDDSVNASVQAKRPGLSQRVPRKDEAHGRDMADSRNCDSNAACPPPS